MPTANESSNDSGYDKLCNLGASQVEVKVNSEISQKKLWSKQESPGLGGDWRTERGWQPHEGAGCPAEVFDSAPAPALAAPTSRGPPVPVYA